MLATLLKGASGNTFQPGPFLISQASGSAAISTTLVINKPTGTRQGDLMIAAVNGDSGGSTWTGDTGWTEVADQGARPNLRIAYKVAGASEGASYTFTCSNSGNLSGTIATYRNAAYDAIGSIATGADPLVVGAVTIGSDNSRVFAAVARNAASITITGPASMQQIAIDNDATTPSRLVEQDSSLSTAGSSGTRSFTMGSTTLVAGILASIKPAASYSGYANYTGSASAADGSLANGNLAITNPAVVPGNVLICFVSASNSAGAATVSLPSGYTQLASSTASGSDVCAVKVGYRFADGTEGTTTTASYSGSSGKTSAQAILAVVGGGITDAAPVISALSTGSATTSVTADSVTATNNGILLFFGTSAVGNSGAVSFTPPSGYTEAIDVNTDSNTDSGTTLAYKEGNSSGGTGTVTATASLSGNTKGYLVNIAAL